MTKTNPAPRERKRETITLSAPIARAGGDIAELSFVEPGPSALRGVNLRDVIQGDFDAALMVAIRVCEEPITAADLSALPACDLAAIVGTIGGFFMSPAEKAAIATMMGA